MLKILECEVDTDLGSSNVTHHLVQMYYVATATKLPDSLQNLQICLDRNCSGSVSKRIGILMNHQYLSNFGAKFFLVL